MTTTTPEKEAELRGLLENCYGLEAMGAWAQKHGLDLLSAPSTEREGRERAEAERDIAVAAGERVTEDPIGAAERIGKLMDAKEDSAEAFELSWLAECVETLEEYGAIHCAGEELSRFPATTVVLKAQISALQALIALKNEACLVDYLPMRHFRRARTALNPTEAKTGEPG